MGRSRVMAMIVVKDPNEQTGRLRRQWGFPTALWSVSVVGALTGAAFDGIRASQVMSASCSGNPRNRGSGEPRRVQIVRYSSHILNNGFGAASRIRGGGPPRPGCARVFGPLPLPPSRRIMGESGADSRERRSNEQVQELLDLQHRLDLDNDRARFVYPPPRRWSAHAGAAPANTGAAPACAGNPLRVSG